MLKDKRVSIRIYMKDDKIDRMYAYSPDDADIIVSSYTNWDELYANREGEYGYTVRIEFTTNKKSGINCMNTYTWYNNRYLGCKRKYIRTNNSNI